MISEQFNYVSKFKNILFKKTHKYEVQTLFVQYAKTQIYFHFNINNFDYFDNILNEFYLNFNKIRYIHPLIFNFIK